MGAGEAVARYLHPASYGQLQFGGGLSYHIILVVQYRGILGKGMVEVGGTIQAPVFAFAVFGIVAHEDTYAEQAWTLQHSA